MSVSPFVQMWNRITRGHRGPDFTTEEVRQMAIEECEGRGTEEQRSEYVAASVALSENEWNDWNREVHEETDEFNDCNDRVIAAGHALGFWDETGWKNYA